MTGWRSTYWKLRRRGSFDFPVLGVAAARAARRATARSRTRVSSSAPCRRARSSPTRAAASLSRPAAHGRCDRRSGDLAFASPNRWTTRTSRCSGASASRATSSPTRLRELRGDDMRGDAHPDRAARARRAVGIDSRPSPRASVDASLRDDCRLRRVGSLRRVGTTGLNSACRYGGSKERSGARQLSLI